MEDIAAVCHAFQTQSSQQQNQNSARSTCGKQCKALLNLTLKNQISLAFPYVPAVLPLIIQIFTEILCLNFSSVTFNRKTYEGFAFSKICKN